MLAAAVAPADVQRVTKIRTATLRADFQNDGVAGVGRVLRVADAPAIRCMVVDLPELDRPRGDADADVAADDPARERRTRRRGIEAYCAAAMLLDRARESLVVARERYRLAVGRLAFHNANASQIATECCVRGKKDISVDLDYGTLLVCHSAAYPRLAAFWDFYGAACLDSGVD